MSRVPTAAQVAAALRAAGVPATATAEPGFDEDGEVVIHGTRYRVQVGFDYLTLNRDELDAPQPGIVFGEMRNSVAEILAEYRRKRSAN